MGTGGMVQAVGNFAFQGNFEEQSLGEELGEAVGANGFVATKNNNLDAESGFNWRQCKSEGGTKNCALCDNSGGVLPCSTVNQLNRWKGALAKDCPDNKLWDTQKTWYNFKRGSACVPLFDYAVLDHVEITWSNWSKPMDMGDNWISTKVTVTHPHQTAKNIGALIFKRIVSHTCTGGPGCTQGSLVADTYKIGWCIKCDRNIWNSWSVRGMTREQREQFAKHCIPRAFDTSGKIKDDFRCDSKTEHKVQVNIGSF